MNDAATQPSHRPDAGMPPAAAAPPVALVHGEPLRQLPQDLYIPPDALKVILESFQGPLDLLLYLIRRQHLDILDIPIAEVTRQYLAYIGMLHDVLRFELAAEYLLMAAILAEIKSRLLLPRPPAESEEEEADPRAELVRRLLEYERYKHAAEALDALPRAERDYLPAQVMAGDVKVLRLPPPVELRELVAALAAVLARAELTTRHAVAREPLSVRARMSELLLRLADGGRYRFDALFAPEEGRAGIIVNFLAILELARERLIAILQDVPLAPVYLQLKAPATVN